MNTKTDVFPVMSCPRCHTGQIEGDRLICPDCGYSVEDAETEFNKSDLQNAIANYKRTISHTNEILMDAINRHYVAISELNEIRHNLDKILNKR